MTAGLRVIWHDTRCTTSPPGWDEFLTAQRLPAVWHWTMVRAVAATHRSAVLAATVVDGTTVRGLVTARFTGARARPGAIPVAGVVDVDCLVSGSLPGFVLEAGAGPDLRAETLAAVQTALRHEYGRRVTAVMFRQLDAESLPAVLRGPAIVREGGPIAVFHNRFGDFEEYLTALRKSRRKSTRRVLRAVAADPDLTVSFTGNGDEPMPLGVDEIRDLYARVIERNHGHWWLRKRWLQPEVARAELAHPGIHRLTYHDSSGRLVAYGMVWDDTEAPLSGAWGMLSPAESGKENLWFHHHALLVQWCIRTGRQELVSGQGTLEEKVQLGYALRRQWAVLVPQLHR